MSRMLVIYQNDIILTDNLILLKFPKKRFLLKLLLFKFYQLQCRYFTLNLNLLFIFIAFKLISYLFLYISGLLPSESMEEGSDPPESLPTDGGGKSVLKDINKQLFVFKIFSLKKILVKLVYYQFVCHIHFYYSYHQLCGISQCQPSIRKRINFLKSPNVIIAKNLYGILITLDIC